MSGRFPPAPPATPSPVLRRLGWGLSVLLALFYLMDGVLRMVGFTPYVEGLTALGYPLSTAFWIGLSLTVPTVLFLIPRTALLGAIILTGYLGGAVATQVRLEDPWFLFPVAFGVLTWGALVLRDSRLWALLD